MFSAGTSSAELDKLIQFSHKQLLAMGYYWVHTLSNPFAYSITSHLRLQSRGFTGGIYHRNDYLYLGWAGRKTSIGYIVDGQPYHIRQGSTTQQLECT